MKGLSLNKETMSLKEITDLLDVRHNNAMRVVEKMIDDQSFGHATQIEYRTDKGNTYQTYQLDKRQSIAVASRLNTALLMRVIDRWQELENGVPKLPQTKLEWMRLAVETEEALQLEASAHLETKHTLKLANIRQIHERHISLEYMVVDIRNQQPEFEITYRDLLKKLREHKMIRKHGVIPLLNQNKSVPFTIRSGGDGSGNRISYIIPEERAALISWYASKTNQDI